MSGIVGSSGSKSSVIGKYTGETLGLVGMIGGFGKTAAPDGWLLCDGSPISRTVYANLFLVISTTWGSGNGSTTFNIPDLEGAFLRGTGTSTLFTQDSTITLADAVDDQMQGHGHQSAVSAGYNNIGSGSLKVITFTAADFSLWDAVGTVTTLGANGSPRSGTETRPNNIGVTYHIKY